MTFFAHGVQYCSGCEELHRVRKVLMPTIAREKTTAPSVNRRSRRTRIALRDALAAEIQATGDLSQVTVTAVTDRAVVTRRTF